MLRCTFLLSSTMIVGTTLSAQGFEQHLGGARAQSGVGVTAGSTHLTSVVLDGSVEGGPMRTRLLRTLLNGTAPEWTTLATEGAWFVQDAVPAGENGLLIGGSFIRTGRNDQDAFIARIGLDGSWQWTWSTDTPDEEEQVLGVAMLPDGEVAGAGLHRAGADSDGLLVRLSATGTLVWLEHFGTDNDERLQGVAADGDHLVGVGRIVNFGGETDAYIVRADATGQEVWWQSWGGIHHDDLFDVVRSGSELVMVGFTEGEGAAPRRQAYLMAFDQNGDTLRTRTWGDPVDPWSARCITVATNGDLLIGGESGTTGRSDALVLRASPTGDLLWQRTYDLQRNDRVDGLAPLPDGGFVATGRCFGPQGADVLLLRKNSSGN